MTSRILCGATVVFSVTTALLGTQAPNSSDRLRVGDFPCAFSLVGESEGDIRGTSG